MTRKDFEAIAAILAAVRWANGGWGMVVHRLADYMETTNPRFDRTRFIAAANKKED